MRVCPKCNTKNREDANFCYSCQYKFSNPQLQARLCPAGKHPMDPDWTSCPYCKAMQGDAPPAPSPNPEKQKVEVIINGKKKKTIVEDPDHKPAEEHDDAEDQNTHTADRKRKTVFDPAQPESAEEKNREYRSGRRIVALLITYSWRPEGQVFPIYEGRNYIGVDVDCEVCLQTDSTLSGTHAAIFCRGANFEISDEKSLKGTYVNDRPVALTGQSLPNYSQIKTGQTLWRFIAIEPDAAAGKEG
ncbi:MAG TPA: FHA domain-containing protein [Blastocatellia bacterium]|nr:FHA domain-containing protein [Blastocatellia bacterium]